MNTELKKQIVEALSAIDRAREVVNALCDGSINWKMSIPAQPDSDPDLVIASALKSAQDILSALTAEPVMTDEQAVEDRNATLAAELAWSNDDAWRALRLATAFHETYERLAPSFGYETRPETRAFNPKSDNGRLMVAVCGEILSALLSQSASQPSAEVGAEPKPFGWINSAELERARKFGGSINLWLDCYRDTSIPVFSATPSEAQAAPVGWQFQAYTWPADLHTDTKWLVMSFASAMACKLAAAERKYGYSNGWSDNNWMDECRQKLVEHLAKGDPRDVANYCAFLWFHGEKTAALSQQPAVPNGWKLVPIEPTLEMINEIRLLPDFTNEAMRVRYAAMLDAAPGTVAAPMQEDGSKEGGAV